MSHLSDKDIDRLAQEAAEQLDIDQNSSGWDALEKTLDQEMPTDKKRRRRWLFFILVPAALLGGMVGIYQMMNSKQPKPELTHTLSNSITTNQPDAPIPQPNNPKITPSIAPSKIESQGNGSQTEKNGSASSIIDQESRKSLDEKPGNNPLRDDQEMTLRASKENQTHSIATTKRPGRYFQQENPTRVPSFFSPGITNKEKGAAGAVPEMESRPRDMASTEIDKPASGSVPAATKLDSFPGAADSVINPVNQTAPNKDTLATTGTSAGRAGKSKALQSMPRKGLVFGLLRGPDISDVNRKGTGKTGINLGLSAGYRLNARLTILSGLYYTHKFYTAYGSDYKPPKGLWFDTVTLSRVVGDCFMYEIPVNLRFDLIARNRNFLFASAGLSSYLMKKENYDFHFTGNSGYYGRWYRSYKVKENYWLGVLNLSAGYERMIGKQWSVMAEPYIKLPLKGLGFGNLQLNSYGFYLGVRFQPKQAKKK